MTKTANNCYLAAVADDSQPPEKIGIFLAPSRKIIGRLYAPSIKKAQKYLDQDFPGARALLARLAKEDAELYPILLGQPTANDRGAGRKASGRRLSVTLSGLPDKIYDKLTAEKNRSAYLVKLVEDNVAHPTAFSIGQQIEARSNAVLYDILNAICKAQTHWIDEILFITTEYGEYQDTNHAQVLLVAIEDAIAALTREPVIVDEEDYL